MGGSVKPSERQMRLKKLWEVTSILRQNPAVMAGYL